MCTTFGEQETGQHTDMCGVSNTLEELRSDFLFFSFFGLTVD